MSELINKTLDTQYPNRVNLGEVSTAIYITHDDAVINIDGEDIGVKMCVPFSSFHPKSFVKPAFFWSRKIER